MKKSMTLSPEWAFRISLALIYIWFGLLKPFGVSPAAGLVENVVFWWDAAWFVPALGLFEVLIGVSFLFPKWTRFSVALTVFHMFGASFVPFFTTPEILFQSPFVYSLEGQYIFKNLLILSASYYLYTAKEK